MGQIKAIRIRAREDGVDFIPIGNMTPYETLEILCTVVAAVIWKYTGNHADWELADAVKAITLECLGRIDMEKPQ